MSSNTILAIILTSLGTLMVAGLGWLIMGQYTIRKNASDGRKALHSKVDKIKEFFNLVIVEVRKEIVGVDKRLNTLETEHKINCPNCKEHKSG